MVDIGIDLCLELGATTPVAERSTTWRHHALDDIVMSDYPRRRKARHSAMDGEDMNCWETKHSNCTADTENRFENPYAHLHHLEEWVEMPDVHSYATVL